MFGELRNKIVDETEIIIRKSGFSDNFICIILRALHFGISLFTGYILLFGSKKWFLFVCLINIIVFSLFFIFDGCILSKLEHRFTNDDFTVIDPFLMLIRVELNNQNRYKYSLLSNIFATIFIIILYYIRFNYKNISLTDSLEEKIITKD